MKNNNKGFTILELLVVIAIIGTLSAIILTSINSARNKANEVAIKSNMDSIKKQAMIWYENHGTYFLNKPGSENATYFCADAYALNSTMFGDPVISKIITQIESLNGASNLTCLIHDLANSSKTSYVFYTILPWGGNICIDNTNKFGTSGYFDTAGVGVGCN